MIKTTLLIGLSILGLDAGLQYLFQAGFLANALASVPIVLGAIYVAAGLGGAWLLADELGLKL